MTTKRLSLFVCVSLGLLLLPNVTLGISLPIDDPTFLTFDDLVGWNWRVLELAGQIEEAPHLPTGTTDWIRLYSNGSPQETPNKTLPPLIKPVISPNASKGDIGPTAEWWYGLDWQGNKTAPGQLTLDTTPVERVLTAGEVLSTIRAIENNPNIVSPVFAFDQNQTSSQPLSPDVLPEGWADNGYNPTERDKWLRARLILVPPGFGGEEGLSWFIGKSANEISEAFSSVTPPPNANPFAPGVDAASGVITYYFRDTYFADFPGEDANGNDFDWTYLPGLYDPRFLDLPEGYFPAGAEGDLPVDNNIGGAVADWGGYFPQLDLSLYENYAFLFSLETLFNNGGPPEAYIIGGVGTGGGGDIIPEPVTIIGIMLGMGGLAAYLRRR